MKKDGRGYIPALAGEFLPETEIRSRAREHFLMVITFVAPEPLYSLRDQAFPKCQAAFEEQQSAGKSVDDIKFLFLFALLDLVFPEESAELKSFPAYQTFRDSSLLIYAAIEELVSWSRRFNLVGKRAGSRQASTPNATNLALMDAVWPLVAALETVLQWHFLGGKAIETPGGIPLFRSKHFIGQQETEDLPPIRLKTIIEARRHISKEFLDEWMPGLPIADPKEINTPAWLVQWEPEPHFRDRVSKDFKVWLNRYIADRERAAYASGLVRGPGKRELSHFGWAAQYQINRATATEIAEEHRSYGVTMHAVEKAVKGILNMIRLETRDARPGRRPPPSLHTPRHGSKTLSDFLIQIFERGARESE